MKEIKRFPVFDPFKVIFAASSHNFKFPEIVIKPF
jgi:hypothetical protein